MLLAPELPCAPALTPPITSYLEDCIKASNRLSPALYTRVICSKTIQLGLECSTDYPLCHYFGTGTVLGTEDTPSSKKTKISDLMEFPLWKWILRKADISYISKIDHSMAIKRPCRKITKQMLSNSRGEVR